MSDHEYDDIVWVVRDLKEFRERLDDCCITEYEGVCEPYPNAGFVIVRMNWCRFTSGRERGQKRGTPEKSIDSILRGDKHG